MSEGANDQQGLARREFLKTTGAVVVGLSVADKVGAQAPAGEAPAVERGLVSGPPDPAQVDSYIAIHPDNTATVFAGYVELGQGGPTALRQIAAEELDLDLDQVKDVRADTFVSTNGFTAASRTAGIGGTELRAAAAEARRVLLELASERLKTPARDLLVTKGVVSVRTDPQRSVRYADLLGSKPFNRKYEPVSYTGGIELPRKGADNAIPKRRDAYRIVGTRVQRPDIAEKIGGTYQYVQHVRLPGMLHGRIVWPRGQGAHAISNPTVASIDEASIKGIPGVRIVRRRNFVGVVAEREWDAVRAAKQLKVTWEPFAQALPGHEGLFDSYRGAKTNDAIDTETGDVSAALSRGVHVVSATYRGPYQSHGTMAPNCAVADVTKDAALVMCSDQGIYQTRNGVARVIGLPIEKIRVQYYSGSNTYGSSCYRDAAQAAAIMSQEVGKPVRLQFSREDEFGWDNYVVQDRQPLGCLAEPSADAWREVIVADARTFIDEDDHQDVGWVVDGAEAPTYFRVGEAPALPQDLLRLGEPGVAGRVSCLESAEPDDICIGRRVVPVDTDLRDRFLRESHGGHQEISHEEHQKH
jgi:nicotinate dehydrogenase subunit B